MPSNLPTDLPSDFGAAMARLSACERLDVEDMKLMILLETAGDPLYQKLADRVEHEDAAALLRANGREETAHAHRLAKAIEILTGEPFEIPALADNPLAEAPPIPEVTAAMFDGMIAAETAGDDMYQRYADHEPNAEVAGLLRQNGREEIRHGERVAKAKALLFP